MNQFIQQNNQNNQNSSIQQNNQFDQNLQSADQQNINQKYTQENNIDKDMFNKIQQNQQNQYKEDQNQLKQVIQLKRDQNRIEIRKQNMVSQLNQKRMRLIQSKQNQGTRSNNNQNQNNNNFNIFTDNDDNNINKNNDNNKQVVLSQLISQLLEQFPGYKSLLINVSQEQLLNYANIIQNEDQNQLVKELKIIHDNIKENIEKEEPDMSHQSIQKLRIIIQLIGYIYQNTDKGQKIIYNVTQNFDFIIQLNYFLKPAFIEERQYMNVQEIIQNIIYIYATLLSIPYTEQFSQLIQDGFLDNILPLFSYNNPDTKMIENILYIFTNICADRKEIREQLFEMDVILSLKDILNDPKQQIEMELLQTVIWFICTITTEMVHNRNTEGQQNIVQIFGLVLESLIFIDIYKINPDDDLFEKQTLQILLNILTYDNACIGYMEDCHFQKIQDFLSIPRYRLDILKLIGNLTYISDDCSISFLENNIHWELGAYIDYPKELEQKVNYYKKEVEIYQQQQGQNIQIQPPKYNKATHQYKDDFAEENQIAIQVQKRSLWVLSNLVTIKRIKLKQEIIDSHIFTSVCTLVGNLYIQEGTLLDALYVILNFLEDADIKQIEKLVTSYQIIESVGLQLIYREQVRADITKISLDIFINCLDSTYNDFQLQQYYIKQMEECPGLLQKIEEFQKHVSTKIYDQAYKIADFYEKHQEKVNQINQISQICNNNNNSINQQQF
ncbi:Armadillo-type fold [Pseudocohnilembus persalinus]|uniref:Armadillo-type fold n=1 Tax=Pseudocohnilembus persalinus TaxID=266149 RepID=A0A0V0Q7M3_PSEPJ|nr:Armadillo-type fold [Pseudocohnilembus persalinus]|eukprot:KRW98233.1 Armadillo-type fold [Pseudocohnilembus persalinus]